MGNNWVIVAIPEKDDKVWKFSSEKVPHMTILSLGEHEAGPDAARILSYMEHAANTMLHKFYMSVDKRDTLGPKDADVLYFETGYLGSEVIKFRESLLKETTISEWFKESDQFPSWLPHLTMGFPETPAKEDDSEYPGIHGVHFDRIALWTGDYEGPEVELQSYRSIYEDSPALSQSMPMIDHELAVIASQRELEMSDLEHADRTIGDLIASLSDDDREIFDIVVGAALDGTDLSVDDSYANAFDDLDPMIQAIAAFVVGSSQSSDLELAHDAMDGESLSQSGVKGMKWGVRKDQSGGSAFSRSTDRKISKAGNSVSAERRAARAVARDKVKAGSATLGEAHLAAMKSSGHRVTNAVLGDKTYWKQAAIIAGVTGVGVGASFAAPALLPASALAGIVHLAGYSTVGSMVFGGGGSSIAIGSVSAVGGQIATGVGLTATFTAASVAKGVAGVGNLKRAVTGNKKVNASYSKLGSAAALRQNQGTKAIRKTLVKNGGLRKKDLQQAMEEGNFLQLDQRVADIDLEQAGKKGMKWGITHVRTASGRVGTTVAKTSGRAAASGGKAAARGAGRATKRVVKGRPLPEDSKKALELKTKVKKAKGTHVLSNDDLELLNKRINLENTYTAAAKQQSTLIKANSKVKTGLDLGKTVNDAIKFANSDAGKLISGSIRGSSGGKHAK